MIPPLTLENRQYQAVEMMRKEHSAKFSGVWNNINDRFHSAFFYAGHKTWYVELEINAFHAQIVLYEYITLHNLPD